MQMLENDFFKSSLHKISEYIRKSNLMREIIGAFRFP